MYTYVYIYENIVSGYTNNSSTSLCPVTDFIFDILNDYYSVVDIN